MTLKKLFSIFLIVISNLNCFSQSPIIEMGIASYYADKYVGKITASGEIYNGSKLTAAHLSLPFGTFVKVTNLENNNTVIVVINDRGPFTGNRIIDLSKVAAKKLDFVEQGVTEVNIEIVESVNGNSIKPTINNENIVLKSSEYYKLLSNKIEPSGYGIQIANYAEIANLMREADNINKTIKKDLVIEVVNHQNSKSYRLILGNFKTKIEAKKYKALIINNFPDCFIIKF